MVWQGRVGKVVDRSESYVAQIEENSSEVLDGQNNQGKSHYQTTRPKGDGGDDVPHWWVRSDKGTSGLRGAIPGRKKWSGSRGFRGVGDTPGRKVDAPIRNLNWSDPGEDDEKLPKAKKYFMRFF